VVREIAAVQDLLTDIAPARIPAAARQMERAGTIYFPVGVRSSPVADFAVPGHEKSFSRALPAPVWLARALTVKLQPERQLPRMPVVTVPDQSRIGPSGTGIAPATAPQTDWS
jgi:hypothetical protein